MKTRLKAKLLTILTILTLGFGWVVVDNIITSNAYAEENTGTSSIFVSPMTQKIILVPGETYKGSISISNNNSATENLEYKAEIGSYNKRQDGDSKDDYGVTDVTEVTNRNIIMKWITLEKETGTVAPNGTDVLNFTIKVPSDISLLLPLLLM